MSFRSIIYVDGFDLYYGAVKAGLYKCLDLQHCFGLLRPDDEIQSIKYFTALIDGSHRPNQEAYLEALETLSKVEIFFGKYKYKSVKSTLPACTFAGSREFQVPEEKRSDVNIATHMIDDALAPPARQLLAQRWTPEFGQLAKVDSLDLKGATTRWQNDASIRPS